MKIDRRAIWERDRGLCGFCGELVAFGDMDLDHTRPRAHGGTNDDTHLRPAHKRCNRQAGCAVRRLPGQPIVDECLNIRVDPRTRYYLSELLPCVNLNQSHIVRQAIEEMARRHKVRPYTAASTGALRVAGTDGAGG